MPTRTSVPIPAAVVIPPIAPPPPPPLPDILISTVLVVSLYKKVFPKPIKLSCVTPAPAIETPPDWIPTPLASSDNFCGVTAPSAIFAVVTEPPASLAVLIVPSDGV